MIEANPQQTTAQLERFIALAEKGQHVQLTNSEGKQAVLISRSQLAWLIHRSEQLPPEYTQRSR